MTTQQAVVHCLCSSRPTLRQALPTQTLLSKPELNLPTCGGVRPAPTHLEETTLYASPFLLHDMPAAKLVPNFSGGSIYGNEVFVGEERRGAKKRRAGPYERKCVTAF